jgi:hypothetical protein
MSVTASPLFCMPVKALILPEKETIANRFFSECINQKDIFTIVENVFHPGKKCFSPW